MSAWFLDSELSTCYVSITLFPNGLHLLEISSPIRDCITCIVYYNYVLPQMTVKRNQDGPVIDLKQKENNSKCSC